MSEKRKDKIINLVFWPLWTILTFWLVFFYVPSTAHASTHVFTSSEFIAECGGGTVNFSSEVMTFYSGSCSMASSRTHWVTSTGVTYYFRADYIGSGSGSIQAQLGCGTGATSWNDATGFHEFSINNVSCTGDPYIQIAGGATNWTSNSTAHITNFCVSDVSYAECEALLGGGGGGGGATTTIPNFGFNPFKSDLYGFAYASSTCTSVDASSTWSCFASSTVPYPPELKNITFGLAIMLVFFFLGFIGYIWSKFNKPKWR